MPVIINELEIEATIRDAPAEAAASKQLKDDPKRLQKILDEVLKKIKSKNER